MPTLTSPQPKTATAKIPKMKDRLMLIGGKWVDAVSGKTFTTLNPATGEPICQVA